MSSCTSPKNRCFLGSTSTSMGRKCEKIRRVALASVMEETPSLFIVVVQVSERLVHGAHPVEPIFLNECKVVADNNNGGDH